jgi:hypothetical protein
MALTIAVAPMKRRSFVIFTLLVYAFTLAGFWVSSVKTLTLFPDKDSYSWQSVPLANNGKSNNFEITSYDKPPYNMRGWIEFNITSIPADVWITSATLRLRVWYKTTYNPAENMGDSTGRIYGAYRLLQPWGERTVNWSNQPNYTDANHATSAVPPGQGGWNGPLLWMDWDIRDIMSDWRSNVTSNYGLVVRDTQEYSPVFYSTQFFTHDQVPNETYYPRLLVTYVSPLALASLGVVLFAEGFFMVVLWRTRVERKTR